MHNKLYTLTVVGFAVVTAVLIYVLRQPQTPDAPVAPSAAAPAIPAVPAPATRQRSAAPYRPAATRATAQFSEQVQSVSAHAFLDTFPEQTRPYLARALRSTQITDQQTSRLSCESNQRLLEGLARKLFIDDYRYAARATGLLNVDDAEQVYKTVRESVDTLGANIEENAYGPLRQYGAVESLSKLYDMMLAAETRNPAYQAVWDVIAPHDPTGQTDLYKDALAYAVLHTQTDEWIGQPIAELKKDLEIFEQMLEGEKLANATLSTIQNTESRVDAYRQLQDAHAVIFAERFVMRGADPELVGVLRDIPATEMGPELRIP